MNKITFFNLFLWTIIIVEIVLIGRSHFAPIPEYSLNEYPHIFIDHDMDKEFIFQYLETIDSCHFRGVTEIQFWNKDHKNDKNQSVGGQYLHYPEKECKQNVIYIYYNTSSRNLKYDLFNDDELYIEAIRKLNKQFFRKYLDRVLVHEIGHNYEFCVLGDRPNTTAEAEYFANTFQLSPNCTYKGWR